MSLPVFKDFDKSTADILSEDFGLKTTLKTKSATPYGVVKNIPTRLQLCMHFSPLTLL